MSSRVPLRLPHAVARGTVVVIPSNAARLRLSFGSSPVMSQRLMRHNRPRYQKRSAAHHMLDMTVRKTSRSPRPMVGSTRLVPSHPLYPCPDGSLSPSFG